MNYANDKRIVMTLDAGGTNLVFTAFQGNKPILEEITLPSQAHDLDLCLGAVVEGFTQVRKRLPAAPVAISFAFPGPADYPNGIIGELPNLPAFRGGGVALGPMLEEKFGLPVFINNDGDLFAYGEALAGLLPRVNGLLEKAGSPKRYRNLLGLTLGTGFGAGIAHDGKLFTGDNAIAGEIWLLRDKLNPQTHVEEHASIRGVRKYFAEVAGIQADAAPSPKDIYDIARGTTAGNRGAALKAFRDLATTAGDAIASAITLIDGLVVIGGGLSGAADLFLPDLVREMNGMFRRPDGSQFRRLVANVYNLEDPADVDKFVKGKTREIAVYGTSKKVLYDPEMRIGVGISNIGTSNAIAIGAYAFALAKLDERGVR